MKNILSENEKTWDIVADQFIKGSSLPAWGPFGVGDDLNLIPEVKDKVFMEIGCGSGRSIKYLINNGAKKVYGLDISSIQIKEAENFNKDAINDGKVELSQGKMEKLIDIEPVDIVCSIYALGWTSDPETTLKNIYNYLKPGGKFIWSWDHSFFSDVEYKDGEYVVSHSYHEEKLTTINNWKKKEGATAYITYRKISTWFQLIRNAGFEIENYYEPEPKNMDWGSLDPSMYYAIQKAKKVPTTFIFVCKKSN